MTPPVTTRMADPPRWDGQNILFRIRCGGRRVPCAISPQALEAISGAWSLRASDLIGTFIVARDRIEMIALAKHVARAEGLPGVLHIWSDDIDDAPAA